MTGAVEEEGVCLAGLECEQEDAARRTHDSVDNLRTGDQNIARILAFNTPQAKFAIECNRHARHALKVQTGENGICLPDPVAMALALDPTISADASDHYVDVETESELTRGMTVVDRLNVAEDERNKAVWAPALAGRKARVYWTIDNQRWKQALDAALK